MLKFILFLVPFFAFQVVSQSFEIAASKYPYYDIIEWKGMGALLLSRDPSGVTKQVNITLVGDQTTSIWDQKFNPKNESFYFISSENARYIYFLDNLTPESGKVYLNQLNSAGNIKSTSVSLVSAIRKLGDIDVDALELINCVVTDKALVYQFRQHNKKTKSVSDIAVFITHHNFLCYAVDIGNVPMETLKDEKYGRWEYIGFNGEQVSFAARDFQNKEKGWSVKVFSEKGKPLSGEFIPTPENDLISIENIGFGTTGKYYTKSNYWLENGLLAQINGQLYLVGAQKKSATGAELTLYHRSEGEWKVLNRMPLNYFIEKKNLRLGIYPINEGIGYHLDHNGYNKVSLISFERGKESPHNDFTERTVYNPSAVLAKKDKKEFQVVVGGRILVFDVEQLNQSGAVKFELIER